MEKSRRRQFLLLSLILLLSAIVIAGCQTAKDEEFDDIDNSENVVDIDSASVLPVRNVGEDFADYIESIAYSTDSATIYISLKENIPSDRIPRAASIFIIPECEMFPYGFGATVRSVSKSNGILLTCSWPDLSQFADEFDISTDNGTLEISEIEVFDQNGNPIVYEEFNPSDSIQNSDSRAGINNLIMRLPLELSMSNGSAWDNLSFRGQVYYGFKYLGANIRKNGRRTIMTFEIEPIAGFEATSIAECEVGIKKDIRIGHIKTSFKAFIGGVPIIFHVTFYLYFEAEAAGSLKFEATLAHEFSSTYIISNASGRWETERKNGDNADKNPWTIGKIDLDGSVSAGLKGGVMIGLYSATSGVGLNVIPKYTLSASASLSSENLYQINPKVENTIGIESEVYVAAKLFGCNLGKYTNTLPKIDLLKNSQHLFPGISNLKVEDGATETEKIIEYDREKHFFLEGLQAEEGLVLMDENYNEINRFNPTATGESDNVIHKKQYLSRLEPNNTYYVAPYYRIFDKTFIGNKYRLETGNAVETYTYRLTIVNCAEKLLNPDKKEFIIKADVYSDGKIDILNVSGMKKMDSAWFYTWIDKEDKKDDENIITFKNEYAGLSLSGCKGSINSCENPAHDHSGDDFSYFEFNILYKYDDYYVYRNDYENGAYSKYYYQWIYKSAKFYLGLDSNSQTPCFGYDNRGSLNTLYTNIYDISVKFEQIDNNK